MISKASNNAIVLILLSSIACADLPQLADFECGNGVVDRDYGEQCDLYEDPAYKATRNVSCADPSDTARRCRYVCSAEVGGFECPAGWGCGDDGVCHEASGTYEEMEDSPAEIGYHFDLNLADINGDQRHDLVGFTDFGINVAFGRRAGTFGSDFAIRVGGYDRGVAIDDVDGDGDDDVMLPTAFGPAVLLGERDRTLAPVVFPQNDLIDPTTRMPIALYSVRTNPMRTIDCEEMIPESDGGILVAAYLPGEMRIQIPEGPRAPEGSLIVRGPNEGYLSEDNAPGDLLVSNIDLEIIQFGLDPVTAADELIFGLNYTDLLEIYEARCELVPQNPPLMPRMALVFAQRSTVQLPQDWWLFGRDRSFTPDAIKKHANVRLIDLDGNGWRDLVISAIKHGPSGETLEDGIFVARRIPFEGFEAPVLDERFRLFLATFGREGEVELGPWSWPLAAADLDGQPGADYVVSNGIFLARDVESATPQMLQIHSPASPAGWEEAVLVDLDNDQMQDVVAINAGVPGLLEVVFLRSTSTGTSGEVSFYGEAHLFPLAGAGSHLQIGDYDGDRLPDVAFIESGEQQSNTSLSVLYGGGAPELVSVGSPGYIHSIAAFNSPDQQDRMGPVQNDPNSQSELIAVTNRFNEARETVWSIALLNGAGRTLVSPLLLSQERDEGEDEAPGTLVLGNFDPDDRALDVAAFGRETVWIAEGTTDGRFSGDVNQFPVNYAGFSPGCSVMAAGNFDPRTSTDEVIGILSVGCDGVGTDSNPAPSFVGQTVMFAGGLTSKTGTIAMGAASAIELENLFIDRVRVLKVADLDGSGQLEVLFAYSAVQGTAGDSGVLIYWNVQTTLGESLTYGEVTNIRADPGTVASAIVILNADADPELEAMILVTEGFGGVRSRAHARLFNFPSRGQPEEVSSEAIGGTVAGFAAIRLLSADIDRDGIEDVVFADGKNVRVFRGVPESGRK